MNDVYYIDRKDYTLNDLIRGIDNRLKSETNEIIIIALKEVRSAYITECENYPYRLIRRMIDYLYTDNQSMELIDYIDISQRELIFNHKDITYYIKHYYNKKDLIDTYNNGKYDIDYNLFSMKILLSRNKLWNLLKENARSKDAKIRFNIG